MKSYPTPGTFKPSSSWTFHQYYAAYLKWMQKVNHPGLRDSNYHADKFKELNPQKSLFN